MNYYMRMITRILALFSVVVITPAAALNPDLQNPYIMWPLGMIIIIEIVVNALYDKEEQEF